MMVVSRWISLFLISLVLLLSGCGYSFFSAKTVATYETPDGKKISYESDKEQVGLDATYELYENGAVKAVRIKVDRAGSQEAVLAAMMQMQASMAALFQKLLPLLEKGALAAGS